MPRHTNTSTVPTVTTHPYNSAIDQLALEKSSLKSLLALQYPRRLEKWKDTFRQAYDMAENQKAVLAKVSLEAKVPRAHTSVMHRIYLGVEIVPKRALVTYCIAICDIHAHPHKLVRKLHFDIETTPQSERKPISHLQFGGGLPSWLDPYQKADFETSDARCEKPRIPCLPPSLALLANWVLMEYEHVEGIKDFIQKPAWIGSIRNAEDAIWKKYFEHGYQHFGTTAGVGRSLGERGYV